MKPIALKDYPVFGEDVPHFGVIAAIEKSIADNLHLPEKDCYSNMECCLVDVAFGKNILPADAYLVHDSFSLIRNIQKECRAKTYIRSEIIKRRVWNDVQDAAERKILSKAGPGNCRLDHHAIFDRQLPVGHGGELFVVGNDDESLPEIFAQLEK